MANEAIKAFNIVLDNASGLEKELRIQVYKSLGINTKDEHLSEYVQQCVEHFDFNVKERKFLEEIKNTIDEELKKIKSQYYEKGSVDYSSISVSLMNKLKQVSNIDFNIDEDLKNLSVQIPGKFPLCGISTSQFYSHFIAKKENITNMIKSYNQEIIDSLLKLTPQLLEEFRKQEEQNKSHGESQTSTTTTSAVYIDKSSAVVNIEKAIDSLIATSKKRYNELQRRLSYLNSGKNYSVSSSKIMFERETIKKTLLQLSDFIEKLSAGKYAQDLISKFSNLQELDIISDRIIQEVIPSIATANNLTNEVEQQYGKQAQVEFKQYTIPTINIDELHNRIVSSSKLSDLLQGKATIEQVLGTFDYDTNKKLENEYSILIDKIITLSMENTKNKISNPDPTPNIEAEIGNSKEDIISLINSNQYLSILQAIPKAQADKYRDFITYGLNSMLDRWNKKATLAKSYEERQISYQELLELFNNFSDYIPLEVANMLKNNIKEMETFLQKNAPKFDNSIRYNTEKQLIDQSDTGKKM